LSNVKSLSHLSSRASHVQVRLIASALRSQHDASHSNEALCSVSFLNEPVMIIHDHLLIHLLGFAETNHAATEASSMCRQAWLSCLSAVLQCLPFRDGVKSVSLMGCALVSCSTTCGFIPGKTSRRPLDDPALNHNASVTSVSDPSRSAEVRHSWGSTHQQVCRRC
jgi:hypothetical protein